MFAMIAETRKPFVPTTTQLVVISLVGVWGVFLLVRWTGPGEWGPGVFAPLIAFTLMSLMNSRGQRMRMFATFVISFASLTYLRFHLTAFGIVLAVLSQLACLAIVQRYPPKTLSL
jgi:hypothetical protein